ncbi:hypothetical protein H9Q73_000179 [Fusarium xylarioides]|nr:hypothetical protein H9Q73_000179 [Fusarium xylarioides]
MSDGLFELPPADTADQWKMNILDDFIQNLKMKDYALRMIEILGDASSCMAPPAESYSSVMDAASGRAFALAIAGWSIELNHEELQPQTSLGNLAGKSYSKLSNFDLPSTSRLGRATSAAEDQAVLPRGTVPIPRSSSQITEPDVQVMGYT